MEPVRGLLDQQSSSGSTALHCTISKCNENATKLLVEAGADQNIKDEDGKTCVALAKEAGKTFKKIVDGKKKKK